jgi:hypothetical protein
MVHPRFRFEVLPPVRLRRALPAICTTMNARLRKHFTAGRSGYGCSLSLECSRDEDSDAPALAQL